MECPAVSAAYVRWLTEVDAEDVRLGALTPFLTLYARVRALMARPMVCPLLRGSSPTRSVAPKQHRSRVNPISRPYRARGAPPREEPPVSYTGGAAAELWGLCARPPAIEIGRGWRAGTSRWLGWSDRS
jgi:hypothetical protein